MSSLDALLPKSIRSHLHDCVLQVQQGKLHQNRPSWSFLKLGKGEQCSGELNSNALIEAIMENAASIETLKGGGRYGHMVFCMSIAKYTAIHHTQPCVLEVSPTPLTFGANDSAAVREDKKLLYYNKVYNFELETI